MATIAAVYENGIFRPTQPVDLPEGTPVEVQPTPTASALSAQAAARRRVFENLSRSYETGDPYAAERHDERQP